MAHNSSLLASLSTEIAGIAGRTAVHVVGVAARPHRGASGVAIGGDLVLTADHTVERERDITVVTGEQRLEATLAGRDPATDLAVLRVSGLTAPELVPAPIPPAGSLVVSVSRTTSGTVSTGLGVITSVGGPLRMATGVVLPAIIRTDAALRPGTAGGALVDSSGAVVGLTTPGLLRGLPVAIPMQEAIAVAQRLAAGEPLGRAYLGVNVQPVRLAGPQQEAAGDGRGLLVFGVAPGGAADQAGLLVGDVLVRFNGRTIRDAEALQDGLAATSPGARADVALLRGAALHELTIAVGERPQA